MAQDSENIQALMDAMSKDWNLHDAKAYAPPKRSLKPDFDPKQKKLAYPDHA
jgi:hypothetical protein